MVAKVTQGPLGGASVVTPSQQLADQLGQRDEFLSDLERSPAEQEYMSSGVPPTTEPVAGGVPQVQAQQPVPATPDIFVGEQDMSPIGQLRNQYIESYTDLYGFPPKIPPTEMNDEVAITNRLQSLEADRQSFASQEEIAPQLSLEEKERQLQLNRLKPLDISYEDRAQMQRLFTDNTGRLDSLAESNVNTLRKYIGEGLSGVTAKIQSTDPSRSSETANAKIFIMNSLGLTSPVEADNLATTAAIMVGTVLPRTEYTSTGNLKQIDSLLESDNDLDAENFNFSLGIEEEEGQPNIKTKREISKQMTWKGLQGLVSNAIANIYKGSKQLDPAIADSPSFPQKFQAAASVIIKGWENAGLIQKVNIDGVDTPQLTPTMSDMIYQSKPIAGMINKAFTAFSTSTPPTKEGYNAGPASAVRRLDIGKGSPEGITRAPDEIKEAKYNAAAVGKTVHAESAIIMRYLLDDSAKEMQENTAYEAELVKSGMPAEEVKRIMSARKRQQKDTGAGRLTKTHGLSAGKLTDMVYADRERDMSHLADNFENPDKVRYTSFFYDPASGRIYDDTVDANLQRSKILRAGFTGNPTPIQVKQGSPLQITAQQAQTYWNNIRNRIGKKAAPGSTEAEMDFLFTIAAALESNTDGKTPFSLLTELTPERLQQYAEMGKALKEATMPVTSRTKGEIAKFIRDGDLSLNKQNLSPAALSALERLKQDKDTKRDNIGYKVRAYIDAYEYMKAKAVGGSFTSYATVAIDMNSAGRAMLASDIVDNTVLERTGLLTYLTGNILGSYLGVRNQNPRAFFTEVCIDRSIDKQFSPAEHEIKNRLKGLFSKFVGDKDFNSDFAKKVLLTTDYGKPARFHMEEARSFLMDHPEFLEEFQEIMGTDDIVKLTKTINDLYTNTLNLVTSRFQSDTPKVMTRGLQMLGTMFAFKGMLGETIPLGGNMFLPTQDELVIEGASGDQERIALTRPAYHNIAAAKNKNIWEYDEKGNWVHREFDPGLGSAAVNQIGPFLGQYRESMIIMKTLNAINGNKKPEDKLFLVPVFDNFICDSTSLAQTMYYANNIALPEVLKWNVQLGIRENFEKQANTEIKKLIKDKNTVFNINSPEDKYYGVYSTLDSIVQYMVEKPTAEQSKFIKELEANGYSYIPDRVNSNFEGKLTGNQIIKLFMAYNNYTKLEQIAKAWEQPTKLPNLKPNYLKGIDSRANNGLIFFMTP